MNIYPQAAFFSNSLFYQMKKSCYRSGFLGFLLLRRRGIELHGGCEFSFQRHKTLGARHRWFRDNTFHGTELFF